MLVDGFEFPPPEMWLPNPEVVADAGKLLLAVSCAGLALFDLDGQYKRRLFTFGRVPVIEQSIARQIAVTCTRVGLGQIGAELFAADRHVMGRSDMQFALYDIELAGPFPAKQHGQAAVAVPDAVEFSTQLHREGYVVWSTLQAWARGGITATGADPAQGSGPGARDVLISPLVPKDAQARTAVWSITAAVQL